MSQNLGRSPIGTRRSRVTTILVLLLLLAASSCSQTSDGDKAITRTSGASVPASPEIGIGDLYAVVVGVSNYANPKIPKLRVSDKDAQDFASFLKTQEKLFRRVHVSLLRNAEATKREVEKQLYYELRKAGKDDTVVVFLSGHGADDPNTPGEFFFLTHDADPQILAASAVHMNRQWFLNKLDSKRVVLIADACHAGGFSGEGVKALPPSLQNFMAHFKESEGKVFITSSRADEVSREKPDLGNSLFTYYLIEGLRGGAADNDGVVTLKALYDYVYRNTKDAANGYQHPTWAGQVVGAFPVALARPKPAVVSAVPTVEPPRQRPQTSQTPDISRTNSAPVAAVPSTPTAAGMEPPKPSAPEQPQQSSEEVERLLKLAQVDDADAKFMLGKLYYEGRGVPKDDAKAKKWYAEAGYQGHVEAQFGIGMIYTRDGAGKDIKYHYSTRSGDLIGWLSNFEDFAQAEKWLHKAADQGHVDAPFYLALLHQSRGQYPNDNPAKMKWFHKAADQGHPEAQFDLGMLYQRQDAGPSYNKEAISWFRKAADQGHLRAQVKLGEILARGDTNDNKQALDWFRKAADQGDANAKYHLGLMYMRGQGVTLDEWKAIRWFREAAKAGNQEAKATLDKMGVDLK